MRVSRGGNIQVSIATKCAFLVSKPNHHFMPACLLFHDISQVESAIMDEDRGQLIEMAISDQVDVQFIEIDEDKYGQEKLQGEK